jgi:hypothetical protein
MPKEEQRHRIPGTSVQSQPPKDFTFSSLYSSRELDVKPREVLYP